MRIIPDVVGDTLAALKNSIQGIVMEIEKYLPEVNLTTSGDRAGWPPAPHCCVRRVRRRWWIFPYPLDR